MTKEKWYRLVYDVLRPIGALLYPQKFYGLENIPEGPAILCAPHSNVADPILISLALGRKTYVHHLAKAESKTMFIFGWLMKKAGSIFVKRGERDIDSFKQCMRVLKAGEKLIVFPEGTRVHGDAVVEPKSGVSIWLCVCMCRSYRYIPARQEDLSRGADRDRASRIIRSWATTVIMTGWRTSLWNASGHSSRRNERVAAKYILARSAGFCFGVERSIRMAEEALGSRRVPVSR